MAPLVLSGHPGTGEPGKGVLRSICGGRTPPEPVVAVEVTLEVVEAPVVDRLSTSWALQATFNDATTDHGGAHLGLQWNPLPGSAANWGGIQVRAVGGAAGHPSPLPSTPNDPNTRLPWQQACRTACASRGLTGWRGEITDTTTDTQLVRDLSPAATG